MYFNLCQLKLQSIFASLSCNFSEKRFIHSGFALFVVEREGTRVSFFIFQLNLLHCRHIVSLVCNLRVISWTYFFRSFFRKTLNTKKKHSIVHEIGNLWRWHYKYIDILLLNQLSVWTLMNVITETIYLLS